MRRENILKKMCSICSEKFLHKKDLDSHMHVKHNQMPYSCKNCGKCYVHEYVMKTHTRSCGNNRNIASVPCVYNNCSKLFVKHKYMNEHVKSFHMKQKVTCMKCMKEFSHRSTLHRHVCTQL